MHDPRSQKFRYVAFRGLGPRIAWGVVGTLSLFGSFLFALPTFAKDQPTPRPWSLWLSTNAPANGGLSEPNWLLRMKIVADDNCQTATVTGALQWKIKEVNSIVDPQPDRYILGVEGIRVLALETSGVNLNDPKLTQRWHSTPMPRTEQANVVEISAPFWPDSLEPAEFRLKVTAAHPAGFRSCYLTSPGIGGPREGLGPDREPQISAAVEEFAVAHHSQENLLQQLTLDAVMEMIVPGQEPEAAVANANLAAQPGGTVTTCSTRSTRGLESDGEVDRFSEYLRNRAGRPCAGVQRFQSRDLQASLTKHVFISGLLLSAGMAMLLDALMGATDAVISRTKTRRKPKK